MPVDVRIRGGDCFSFANVSDQGALIVAPISFDSTKFNELAEPNVAYNFYAPTVHKQFVLTGIVAQGDQQVGQSTNATVIIYEATSASTTVVDKVLFQIEIARNQLVPLVPLNILVSEGKFVNAKTDDDDIHMTLMGYFVSV